MTFELRINSLISNRQASQSMMWPTCLFRLAQMLTDKERVQINRNVRLKFIASPTPVVTISFFKPYCNCESLFIVILSVWQFLIVLAWNAKTYQRILYIQYILLVIISKLKSSCNILVTNKIKINQSSRNNINNSRSYMQHSRKVKRHHQYGKIWTLRSYRILELPIFLKI